MPNITQKEISEQQLQNIITEVNSELESMMKSEIQAAKLAKARPGEETPGEGQDDSSKTDPAGDNTASALASPDAASASPDAAGSDSAPPADDASAPPPGDDGSAPPADGSAPGGDPAADAGPIDPQQLMAEYSKLSPEDLKSHYLAVKEALIQVLGAPGADDGGSAAPPPPDASAAGGPPGPDASASAPPPPPAASAGPPPADDGGPTLKAEISSGDKLKSPGPENGENPLHKAEMDALNKKIDEANAVSVALLQVVKKVVEKPLRKSVQFLADVTPAPAAVDVTKMKREDIRAKLKVVASSTSLKKSDRDLITGYDLNTVKADQIAHLLK